MGVLLTHPLSRGLHLPRLRACGETHRQALRQVANRWTGILHTCLQRGQLYNETTAWQHLHAAIAT